MIKLIAERHIDELGRIVIPIDLRIKFKLNEGDVLFLKNISDEKLYFEKSTLDFCSQLEINTQLIHRIDELGRIHISMDIRKKCNIVERESLKIYLDESNETIILSK